MYNIYNKKLKYNRPNPGLVLLRNRTLVLVIQTNANFAIAIRSKPIT